MRIQLIENIKNNKAQTQVGCKLVVVSLPYWLKEEGKCAKLKPSPFFAFTQKATIKLLKIF